MNIDSARNFIERLLSQAGIRLNGSNPWDMQVYNEQFFSRAVAGGSLRIGEAYVDKWWDCRRVDEFFNRILRTRAEERLRNNWPELLGIFLSTLFNLQTVKSSFRVGRKHYDLGNDLFAAMLDKQLVYTCGYWAGATTLDEAQTNKLNLTCQKLGLRPGMRILDIGSGWGGFAKFAAEKYDVKVTGVTISREQKEFSEKLCVGLPVEIQLRDYRKMRGKFDRVVSLGMFEHVGYKNYRRFMELVNEMLEDDGLFLLHTIGSNMTRTWTDPWLDRYIFPGSLLPSIQQIGKAIEHLFVMEDWHNFSADYDKTLMAWHQNFVANWAAISHRYDGKFYRMWTYYLLSCAGSFRARKNQLWQIVLSKGGVPGGYVSVR